MPPSAIRCRGLVKRYEDVTAVDGLDLEVFRGECFGLLGPNGAGKTTTIEILEGLTVPDAGDVEVLGSRWTRDGHALRERLGISLQETQLADKLTVEETVRLFRSFYRTGRHPEELLGTLSLVEKRKARVGKLSGGQRQRLTIARAILRDPAVLLLDEATSAIDNETEQAIQESLAHISIDRTTIVIAHRLSTIRHAHRIHVMEAGRLVEVGTHDEMLAVGGLYASLWRVQTGERAEV